MRTDPLLTEHAYTPSWMSRIPRRLLGSEHRFEDRHGCARLEQWLAQQGLPRPTLLQLATARALRHSDRPLLLEQMHTRRSTGGGVDDPDEDA